MSALACSVAQFAVFILLTTVCGAWLGAYMARVFTGRRTLLDPLLRPLERVVLRLAGVDDAQEMTWRQYASALLCFSGVGLAALYLLLREQGHLPPNPQAVGPMHPLLALNTAVSFVTNTNWQAYSGETAVSYLAQMAGLSVQNFLSAATGACVAVALVRGLTRRNTSVLGNFWVDLTRAILWVLLPLSLAFALVLVSQGVVQSFGAGQPVQTVEGGTQVLPLGPVASQQAIKVLGVNGGGFYNANSSHPFENPTPLSSFLQALAMLLIPAGFAFMFGNLAGDRRQGHAIFGAMALLFAVCLAGLYWAEARGNPLLAGQGIAGPSAMEGKEVRFGVGGSALFATATTAASCGAVNAMHDSLTPLAGMVAMLQILMGEVVFGGVGTGLCGMLVFAVLAVFIAGLMVGRTPEYLGKKIQVHEMVLAVVIVLVPSAVVLLGASVAAVSPCALRSLLNTGPHGLSELLYAFASAANNNGSAFAGLSAETPFFNALLGLAMLVGRFGVIVPTLALAGSLAAKRSVQDGPGTLPTTGLLFALLLAAVVVIVGGLTFFPALALGPVVEHLRMVAGHTS